MKNYRILFKMEASGNIEAGEKEKDFRTIHPGTALEKLLAWDKLNLVTDVLNISETNTQSPRPIGLSGK